MQLPVNKEACAVGLTQRRRALGGPALRRLAAGLLLSRTGDQLTTIALLWLVLDLTGSGAAVGLVLLCAGLPPVVTGPLLGRVLDRWSPRQVMVADNLLRAALVGAIPALHWLGRLDLPLLYGLSVAAGALIPATDVGVRVVLPRLVDEDELEHANALLSIGDQVSALVGPACGGLLVGLVGAPPVLLLDAVSFLAMAAARAHRDRHRRGDADPRRRRADLGAVRDLGVVSAPATRSGPPARPGLRRPPGRVGRSRAPGGRRGRAAPGPRPLHDGDRRVRGHLHPRRRGRPLRPGPPPPPGPGATRGCPGRLTAAPGRTILAERWSPRGNPVRFRSCPAAVC